MKIIFYFKISIKGLGIPTYEFRTGVQIHCLLDKHYIPNDSNDAFITPYPYISISCHIVITN